MAKLSTMQPININATTLSTWGSKWLINSSFSKKEAMDFGTEIDKAFGIALASLLSNTVTYPKSATIMPLSDDVVEIGPTKIIGGIRPQDFDVAYRPDGARVVFDSKTLNAESSIQKNWQNMINDLGTEATTVHTRFPYAIVAFILVIPKPALKQSQEDDIIRTLERLCGREKVIDQMHLAEAISLIIWDPSTGQICPNVPNNSSPLRIEKMHSTIEKRYYERYKGLPPHK